MKVNPLSSFQKQQYITYLEGQLQKFSTFMLTQRKENDRFNYIEQLLQYQSNLIHQLQNKVQLLDTYQQQNFNNCEQALKQCQEIQSHNHRIRRLEQRAKHGCDDLKSRRSSKEEQTQKQAFSQLEIMHSQLSKRVKKVQEQITKNTNRIHNLNSPKNINREAVEHSIPDSMISEQDLKKLQKKLKKYLNKKVDALQEMIVSRKKSNKSRKSRSRSPIEMQSIDTYQVYQPSELLSSFRVSQNTHKSQFSTGSQKSYSEIQKCRNPITSFKAKQGQVQIKLSKKSKEKKIKRSRSKSKSAKSQSISSKKLKVNKSQLSISQNSVMKSSVSRSKSKRNKSKSRKSHSKSKSKHSNTSLIKLSPYARPTCSLYQKCKRPSCFKNEQSSKKPSINKQNMAVKKQKKKRQHK